MTPRKCPKFRFKKVSEMDAKSIKTSEVGKSSETDRKATEKCLGVRTTKNTSRTDKFISWLIFTASAIF